MKSYITKHQLNHLIEYLLDQYEVFGPIKEGQKFLFSKIEKSSDLELFAGKTIIPFKKILFPNKQEIKSINADRKIAFLGLPNCDAWALEIFLKNFIYTDILPKRENIFVLTAQCVPDQYCFCDQIGKNQLAPTDLFIQEEIRTKYSIFGKSKSAEKILRTIGFTQSPDKPILHPIGGDNEKFNLNKITSIIDNRQQFEQFWQKISEQCFGCGACSVVCPLCFCTRQSFSSGFKGESITCLNWDTCFGKRFSEIQNRYDLRPQNVDRLYNWYHHKFVRAPRQYKEYLCTGCGRCAEACPAHLNIKNIIKALVKESNEKPS